jgi:hypothetical protein
MDDRLPLPELRSQQAFADGDASGQIGDSPHDRSEGYNALSRTVAPASDHRALRTAPPGSSAPPADAAFVVTDEGRLVFGGPGLAKLLGIASGSVPSLFELMSEGDAAELRSILGLLDCGLAGRTRIRLRVRDQTGQLRFLTGTAQAEYGGSTGRSYFLRCRVEPRP